MGKIFVNTYILFGGGSVGALRPGMLHVPTGYYDAYAQDTCVVRFERSSLSTTSYLRVSVEEMDGGGQSVASYIRFDYSNTQYFDLTELLRCWMLRPTPTTTIAKTRTRYRLTVEEYDSLDANIGSRVITIYAYDAKEPFDIKYDMPLPDTFRMIASAALTDFQSACVRATSSACDVGVYDQNGVAISTLTSDAGDLYTAQWRFLYNTTSLATKVTLGTESEEDTARVIWEPCGSDKAQLRWWSPESGGYKSVAVELLGITADKSGDAAYIKNFDNVWAAKMADGIRSRVPLCTMRDVMYYRDLYVSDEVEMRWSADVYNYSKRVRIVGTPPDAPSVGVVDMEFTLQLSEVSTLW